MGYGVFEFPSLVTLWLTELLSNRPGTGDAYASKKSALVRYDQGIGE